MLDEKLLDEEQKDHLEVVRPVEVVVPVPDGDTPEAEINPDDAGLSIDFDKTPGQEKTTAGSASGTTGGDAHLAVSTGGENLTTDDPSSERPAHRLLTAGEGSSALQSPTAGGPRKATLDIPSNGPRMMERKKTKSVVPDEQDEKRRDHDFGGGRDAMAALRREVLRLQKRLIVQQGATLCWRNICYQHKDEMLLAPTSGIIRPGQMTCILSGPSSGVRQMLDVLARRTKASKRSEVYSRGEILLNKLPPGPFFHRTVALVPKTDNHLAHLTVRETLEFSARMRSPVHATEREIMDHVELILRWLGMDGVQDTIVGDANIKGISGGQKRRLSIGVELVSGYSVLIADLPTNGLDAKTAFDVVDRMRRVCETGKSCIMALASPSPELLMLFDNVIVVAKGETLYNGPVDEMQAYFERQGFRKPEEQSLPVWLEDLVQKPKDYASPEKRQDGGTNRMYWRDMARYYKSSPEHRALHLELLREMTCDVFDYDVDEEGRKVNGSGSKRKMIQHQSRHDLDAASGRAAQVSFLGRSQIKSFDYKAEAVDLMGQFWSLPVLPGWTAQVKKLVKRRWMTCKRNKVLIYSRLFQVLAVGICLGMLFFQLDEEIVWNRLSLIAFSLEFLGFGAVPFIPDCIANERPTFYYQSDSRYFSVSAWYFANWLVELPQSALEVLLFTLITYLLSGLSLTGGGIILFYIMAFLLRFSSWGLCQICCAIFPSGSVAAVGATTIIPLLFSYCGFLIPISDAEETNIFSIICNRLSFFSYPFQALVAFEMDSVAERNNGWKYLERSCSGDQCPLPDVIYWGDELHTNSTEYTDKMFITALRLNDVVVDPTKALIFGFVSLLIWNFIFNFLAFLFYKYINFNDNSPSRWKRVWKKQKAPSRGKWPEEKKKGYKPPLVVNMSHNRDDQRRASYERLIEKEPIVSGEDNKIQGVYVEFQNLNYKVTTSSGIRLHLLKGLDGYVAPGDCIALMGPSGAGKSTLLDVLAGKKNTGEITGDIKFNGGARPFYFSRINGYVEQFNSHMDCLTVWEALEFAAELRMDSKTPAARRRKAISETLEMLEIDHLSNSKIGNSSEGISLEAMKKLTIAVELIGRPGLLFLDEPTTGLDSAAAINVMKIVRQLADQGQSVICTIHQPPALAYAQFNKILLLQAGGTLAYFGPTAELNDYVEEAGAGKMPEGKNPADWAIEAIACFDTKETWEKHGKNTALKAVLAEQVCPKAYTGQKFESAYATGCCKQTKALIKRMHRFFWRDHHNVWARLLGALIIGVVLGIGMLNIKDMPNDFKQITFLSVFYVTVVYCTESAAEEVPILVNERPTFYREVDSKFFSVFPYYLSRWLAQQPLMIVQGLVLSVPMFFLALGSFPSFGEEPIGKEKQIDANGIERFLDFLMFYFEVYLTLTVSATFSQLFAAASPNEGVGNVMYFTMCCLSRLFSGFIIFLANMGGIPDGDTTTYAPVRLVGRIANMLDFFKYAFYTFGASFINGTSWDGVAGEDRNAIWRQIVNPFENKKGESYWMPHWWLQTTEEYNPMNQSWLQKHQFLVFLFVTILLYNVLTFLLLRCKRWDKR